MLVKVHLSITVEFTTQDLAKTLGWDNLVDVLKCGLSVPIDHLAPVFTSVRDDTGAEPERKTTTAVWVFSVAVADVLCVRFCLNCVVF